MNANQLEIAALEKTRQAAMLAADCSKLDVMFADDGVYTHSSGAVHDKAGYVEALRKGEFIYKKIETFDETIRVSADSAVMTGRARHEVQFPSGFRVLESRFLSVWVRTGGNWQHLAWQSTSLPAQGK